MSADTIPAAGGRERRRRIMIALALVAGLAALLFANLHLVLVAVSSEPGCVAHVEMRASAAGRGGFTAAQSACSPSSDGADQAAEGKRP
jgi:hypothetical protein